MFETFIRRINARMQMRSFTQAIKTIQKALNQFQEKQA
jgi:hypothetical protein